MKSHNAFIRCFYFIIVFQICGESEVFAQNISQNKLKNIGDITNIERRIPPNRVIILDFSGSMEIPSQSKKNNGEDYYLSELASETARRLLNGNRNGLEQGRTGLVVFGHNVKHGIRNGEPDDVAQVEKSCRDIKVELPYKPYSQNTSDVVQTVVRKVMNQKAKGETPLLQSIEKAANLMTDGGAIVLLTDLNERICSQKTPCEVIREQRKNLSEKRIFLTHIVAYAGNNGDTSSALKFATCAKGEGEVIKDETDIPDIVESILNELNDASRFAQLEVQLDFDKQPILLPKFDNELFAPKLNLENDLGQNLTRKLSTTTESIENTEPGIYQVNAVFAGRVAGKGETKALRDKVNSLKISIPTSSVEVDLVDIEGTPLPADAAIEWSIEGLGEKVIFEGSVRQKFTMLNFQHKLTARYGDTVTTVVYDPNNKPKHWHLQLTMIASSDAQRAPEVKSRLTLADNILFKSDPPLIKLVAKNKNDGAETIIPLSSARRKLPIGDYDFQIRFDSYIFHLSDLTLSLGDSVMFSGKVPASLVEAELSLHDDNTIWNVKRKNDGSVRNLIGRRFRQRLLPGNYKITAKLLGLTAEGDLIVDGSTSTLKKKLILH